MRYSYTKGNDKPRKKLTVLLDHITNMELMLRFAVGEHSFSRTKQPENNKQTCDIDTLASITCDCYTLCSDSLGNSEHISCL